jgi:SAM-dependent methyltransferase
MEHADHVRLIRDGVAGSGPTWADIGSGHGAFTLALAELLGPGRMIVSVDRDRRALADQAVAVHRRFPEVRLDQRVADFTAPLELPTLDGMVMANALHFVQDKEATLEALLPHLRPGGRFVLVEYGTDRGNPWVPYPLSFARWQSLAESAGLRETKLIGQVPSRFLGSIYAAASLR